MRDTSAPLSRQNLTAINLGWIIAILVLAIIALLTYSPRGDIIRDYVSFASAISSIVLALVAIIYSMVSNRDLASSLASLKDSAQTIQSESEKLQEISGGFTREAKVLYETVSNIPGSLRDMGDKVDTRLSEISTAMSTVTVREGAQQDVLSEKKSVGTGISLYSIAKSFESGKAIDVSELEELKDTHRGFIFGFLSSASFFSPVGLNIRRSGTSFSVDSLGDLDSDALLNILDTTKNEIALQGKLAIDNYFLDDAVQDPDREQETSDSTPELEV